MSLVHSQMVSQLILPHLHICIVLIAIYVVIMKVVYYMTSPNVTRFATADILHREDMSDCGIKNVGKVLL